MGHVLHGPYRCPTPHRMISVADARLQGLASIAAMRSNCMKRRVGCVIVRGKEVIATGYNGTARGTTNCNEGGCPRCNGGARAGQSRTSRPASCSALRPGVKLTPDSKRLRLPTRRGERAPPDRLRPPRQRLRPVLQHVRLRLQTRLHVSRRLTTP